MNCTKYTLERLSLALKRFKPGKFLETKFAMSYFRQDPSLTSAMKEFAGKCANCESTENLEIDHVWPRSLGGQTTGDNLQVLCKACNQKKGAVSKGHANEHTGV